MLTVKIGGNGVGQIAGVCRVGAFLVGKPLASQIILAHVFVEAVTFPAGFTGAKGASFTGVAATAQTDFDIQKNGVGKGTMRFAAGASVATFVLAADLSFTAGNILTVVAPGVSDVTLVDVCFTLPGVRV